MEDRYTEGVKNAWKYSAKIASSLNSEYIGLEHLLVGIAHEKDDAGSKILSIVGITEENLLEILKSYKKHSILSADELYVAPQTKRILVTSVEEANRMHMQYVGTEHLLLAILHEGDNFIMQIMDYFNVTQEKIIDAFNKVLSEDSYNKKDSSLGELSEFAIDLNERAKEGKIDPVIGRQDEINRVIQILMRRNKNNPVLIGEPGVGKTAIAEGLAQRIITQDVPEMLKNCKIISLNIASIVAGTKYRGEFEERLKKIIYEIKKHKDWILFIDEIHTLVGAGSGSGESGSMDAANIMKPSLARGELRCIGATTLNEYKKYIEKDAALERRFQSVIIGEPNREDTIKILKGLRDRYEAFHNAKITDEAILNAVDLSTQYINDRFQPDKSIDLIDEASAKVKIQASLSPDNIKLLENKLKSVQKEKTAAVSSQNFEKAAELRDIAKSLSDKIAEYKKAKKDDNLKPLVVTGEDIAEVVSKWTGIPLQSLKQSDSERLLHLEDELKKRVIGQDEAIHAVAQAIRRARAGMKDPKHPIGSFIFLGSTGVGKTELARALAEYMFGNESALVRFDMSEYMEKHEVSRLIGAPPGYVGYDEGGQLTDVIRRKPYSIILFDEIEKAHSDFFNILLQVLDDGRLTDGQGRTVDFTNCIIIMTSNLGAKYLNKNIKSLGFEITGKDIKEISFENQKTQILEEVKNTFRPEFINRIDEMIVFKPLEEKELKSIIKLLLKNTENKMNSLHVKLSVSDKAEEYLIKEGYSFEYGARPLKRLIQKKIENNISDMIIKGDLKGKRQLNIDLNNEKQLVFNTL